jgi:hypothetical protein
MSIYHFDAHQERTFELSDIMMGPDPLLAAVEADKDCERHNDCAMDWPTLNGMVWLPSARRRWAERKRHSMNVGVHIFWSMQVNHWMQEKVC